MPSSGAFACSDFATFVSFVVKSLSQRRTPSYSNQYAFRRRMPPRIATSKVDLRGHLASEPQSPCFARPSTCFSLLRRFILPVMSKLSPCYCPVPRAPPIFLKLLLSKLIFLQKPVRRPPTLPVSCLLSGSIRVPSPSPTRA